MIENEGAARRVRSATKDEDDTALDRADQKKAKPGGTKRKRRRPTTYTRTIKTPKTTRKARKARADTAHSSIGRPSPIPEQRKIRLRGLKAKPKTLLLGYDEKEFEAMICGGEEIQAEAAIYHQEYDYDEQLTPEKREAIMAEIRNAFYDMPPELVVDLFSDFSRESERETVSLGTRYWLETEFRRRVVGTDWDSFSDEQVRQLRKLIGYMTYEFTEKAIVRELGAAQWFQDAFESYKEVANDMYTIYFRRDVQILEKQVVDRKQKRGGKRKSG